jgi:hypothetical protein
VPGPIYFAWTGGAIVEQLTLVTNGTTHGVLFELATIVGDTNPGIAQVINVASTDNLQQDAGYHVTGPGLDAYFIYDNATTLSGLPNSLNLTSAPTSGERSGDFSTTKAVPIGTVLGTVSHGSSTVALAAGDLPAGIYGIQGIGVGETDIPIGTTDGTSHTTGGGITLIGSAYLNYDGSGHGTMYIIAATPHTSTRIGDLPPHLLETFTTYSIASQPVRATTSGEFPMVISGFPVEDPFSVTAIPSGALMSLSPGLVYNITGNGIPVGATFVAPSSGSSIELDLAATASEINAILTITGPRTPTAPFDPAVHNRFDEEIISFDISQDEGSFATLTAQLKNPAVGLLALGRYLWCWLSYDQAWNPAGNTPDLVPLFNGRLIGVPKLQAGEIVELQFLARPDDFNAQKQSWATSLQVPPYYDPVWIARPPNPDTVLETYSALWHIDRVSLGVSISDILDGEDGIIDIGEDISLYNNFSLSYGQPPLVSTMVTGTVTWAQQAEGRIDITQPILNAFKDQGSYYKWVFPVTYWGTGGGGLIQTLSGNGLKSDWPKPGTSIGGGWSLSTLLDGDGIPLCYIIDAVMDGQVSYNVTYEAQTPPASQAGSTTEQSNVNIFLQPTSTFVARFPMNVYKIRMVLEYRANRKRTEVLTAVVTAGVQRELSDSAESDHETISLSSDFIDKAVDPDGSIPIGNVAYRSYFQTARGNVSFEYLLLAARAKMRARARAVDITFAVPWQQALAITLRHNVQISDRRLPGGGALGKVKSYKLSCATGGIMLGEFTIGCAIGTGDPIAPQAGVNSYVEDAYVDAGYQTVTGAQITLSETADLAYQTLDDFAVIDDGLDLTRLVGAQAVNECVVTNLFTEQLPALLAYSQTTTPTNGNPLKLMETMKTTVTLDLKPVQGSEFSTAFFPAVTPLVLPKTIDLSASTPGELTHA